MSTLDTATIREFLTRTRPLCDAATEGPWHRLHDGPDGKPKGQNADCMCAQVWSRKADSCVALCDTDEMGEGPPPEVAMANAAFIADARESLPQALNIIEALLAERDRDAPAIRAAVRLAALRVQSGEDPDGHLVECGLAKEIVNENDWWIEPTDLGRAVCDLDERMGAGDA